ncbi:iron chelate uptake ABC transporter family permease subunit [Kocuria sp. TGY1127_2]|uniref:iron chelate uptake ABC transporter family permease subunit n=1 Tax=Kocuria sp. TGY1127_2 TaxID=2711328 RepID=UPI001A9BC062|nr:iron chelate uptake ABC transporter family permease subunit [Kocuria sp. TGY1127_2]
MTSSSSHAVRTSMDSADASSAVVREGRLSSFRSRLGVVVLGTALLLLCCGASIAIGSRSIPIDRVWHLVWHPDESDESYIVSGMRVTRTLIGIVVGAALAVAGAVMQAVTRNPLADPGLLGVNSGASLAIVLGASLGNLTSVVSQFFLSAIGALAAAVVVYVIAASGGGEASPVRLVLAGIAFSAASGGIVGALLLLSPRVFDTFRYWDVGALTRQDVPVVWVLVPVLAGLLMVLLSARGLSDMALGDDVAEALGTNVALIRGISLVALTVLCATATAVAGPIGFVGLVVPLFASWVMGPRQGWIILLCLVGGPSLLLVADVLGRVLARPSEIAVGVLTAFVGSPALLWMVVRLRGDRR